jgi:restriction system protein
LNANSNIWELKGAEKDISEIRHFMKASSVSAGANCPMCNADSMVELLHKPTYSLHIDGQILFEGNQIDKSPVDYGAYNSKLTEQIWVDDIIKYCRLCGWWRVVRLIDRCLTANGFEDNATLRSYQACTGVLKQLSDIDISIIIQQARLEILKWENLHQIEMDPFLFEQVVNSEIRNLGYNTIVTAKTRDGGLDIIGDANGEMFGIQVKRSKNTIGVEQIRSIVGALVEKGYTSGIFVTTSRFSQDSVNAAGKSYPRQGYRVELVDGDMFMKSLEISQRKLYTSGQQLAEYYQYHLKSIVPEHNIFDDDDCSIENGVM